MGSVFGNLSSELANLSSAPANSLGYIYGQYGVNPSSKDRGNELQAAITREMWDDYQTTYMPYLDKLTYAGSTAGQAEMTNQMLGTIDNRYKGMAERTATRNNRNLGRFGIANDSRQSASNQRRNQLTAALGLSQDKYNARLDATNRVEGLLTGGALSKEGLTGS